jgi:hypothetical protein
MPALINRAIIPIINDRGISAVRLNNLIYIKEFIDRVASRLYLQDIEIERIEKKYGVKPDIITWGDYFQAEIATSMKNVSDLEFLRAIETVKFDIISSYSIFMNKEKIFFEWIDNSIRNMDMSDITNLNDEEKEIIHLKILMDYYVELGITGNFLESETLWYTSFKEAKVV